MWIEKTRNAPIWLCNVAEIKGNLRTPIAIAAFRLYPGVDDLQHPALRDRTDDVTAMLQGLVRNLEASVARYELTGAELKHYGFEPSGAQYRQLFCVLVV